MGREVSCVPESPPNSAERRPRHLRLAINAAGVALWSWNVDTDRFTMDAQGYRPWIFRSSPFVIFEDLSAKIHPADRDRTCRAALLQRAPLSGPTRSTSGSLPALGTGAGASAGAGADAHDGSPPAARVMTPTSKGGRCSGVLLDVTGRKQAEESNELLRGEMSHRVKNLLSIAAGLTAITSRSVETAADMAKQLPSSRLGALGRAHDLVRPVPGRQRMARLLGDLLTILLAPYDDVRARS